MSSEPFPGHALLPSNFLCRCSCFFNVLVFNICFPKGCRGRKMKGRKVWKTPTKSCESHIHWGWGVLTEGGGCWNNGCLPLRIYVIRRGSQSTDPWSWQTRSFLPTLAPICKLLWNSHSCLPCDWGWGMVAATVLRAKIDHN